MRLNDAAKVGLATLTAAGLLVWVTFALRGPLGGGGNYLQKVSFTDARGIQEGAPVRVRGVDVGQVQEVALGSRGNAEVTLRVSREYSIRPDDLIQIVGGTLGFGQPYVEILPGGRASAATPGPENILPGEAGPKTETIISRTEELLINLNGLVGKLNRVTEGFATTVENPKLARSFERTLTNFEKISTSTVVIAKNMEGTTSRADRLIAGFEGTARQLDRTLHEAEVAMRGFRGTAGQTEGLMRDARQMVQDTRGVVKDAGTLVKSTGATVESSRELVTDLRGAVGENRDRVKRLFESLDTSLAKLNSTLDETRSFIGDPVLRSDLKATATNVRSATENLNELLQNFRGIADDTQVQDDLRQTLTNLRDASREAAETFKRVRSILGDGEEQKPKVMKTINTIKGLGRALGGTELRLDSVYGVESNHPRLDLDATVPWSDNTFYRLGLFDFGDNLRFNAQAGRKLRSGVWGRAGIHGSRLGVGLDFGKASRPPVALDLYGVDRPRLDARGYIPIGRSLDISLGVDNIFRRPDPVFGLRYRR